MTVRRAGKIGGHMGQKRMAERLSDDDRAHEPSGEIASDDHGALVPGQDA
jgi:hypothetical protein